MPNGDPLILGSQNNQASLETKLVQAGGVVLSAFSVENHGGGGIRGQGSGGPSANPPDPQGVLPFGVWGDSSSGCGVYGASDGGYGVYGLSTNSVGVEGESTYRSGVQGASVYHSGVRGISDRFFGVEGVGSDSAGVYGASTTGTGVFGTSWEGGVGVLGQSDTATGVEGISFESLGVHGDSITFTGVFGTSQDGTGVHGVSDFDGGVHGRSLGEGYGVAGESFNVSVYAHNYTTDTPNDAYLGTRCCAGDFYGTVYIHGPLYVTGSKHFRIDHPLDPANKFLTHSAVESSEMKNIYDGVATLDEGGEALVELPEYFEALNKDFRYQLTPIGASGRDLHVAEEIHDNRFRIGGGASGMKVSWQVSGIRKDAWAVADRTAIEEEKPAEERGYYLHPALYGEPEERGIVWARYGEHMQKIEEQQGRIEELRRQMGEERRQRTEEMRRRMEEGQEGEEPPEATT